MSEVDKFPAAAVSRYLVSHRKVSPAVVYAASSLAARQAFATIHRVDYAECIAQRDGK